MQSLARGELLGFVELQVGSIPVQVPIRAADPKGEPKGEGGTAAPVAAFEVEGDAYAIVVRGGASEQQVQRAVASAARDALRHLSRKLLN